MSTERGAWTVGALCCFAALSIALLGACGESRIGNPSSKPMGTRLRIERPSDTQEAWRDSRTLAQSLGKLVPEVHAWRAKISPLDYEYCNDSGSIRQVEVEVVGTAAASPLDLLRLVVKRGPAHGFYPDVTAPVRAPGGYQLTDTRPDGFTPIISALRDRTVSILVYSPCATWTHIPGFPNDG